MNRRFPKATPEEKQARIDRIARLKKDYEDPEKMRESVDHLADKMAQIIISRE